MDLMLITGLEKYFEFQLGDRELAQFYSDLLRRVASQWKDDTARPSNVDLIIAFSFGQRRDINGNALPDPLVSPRLKQLLLTMVTRFNCTRGIVQWEVAQAEGPQIPNEMKVVRPKLSSVDGTAEYLSTFDICKMAEKEVGEPARFTVCVVAHRHHAWRCIQTLRSVGFAAWAPYEELPDQYDAESSQPWCRSPEKYIIHDLIARLRAYHEK